MGGILSNLRSTVISGIILAIIMIVVIAVWHPGTNIFGLDGEWWRFFLRLLHVLSAVMWIGLLWYFNFVQIPNMPKIPDEQKPAISKVIAPAALFWFRWGAMGTIVTGVILAIMNDYFVDALLIGIVSDVPKDTAIGIGMWLGAIMWFNVWFIIWPNQKKALGIIEVEADVKAKSARTAMLFSRTNTLLSIPMLYAMVSAQNLF
jgi:uncharacterized membrane protein